MPKPTPRPKGAGEGSNIVNAMDFIKGASATQAETNDSTDDFPENKPATANKKRAQKEAVKEPEVFVGVRIPQSVADMLQEYTENYALRSESKNFLMAEGIRNEITTRLKKAKRGRG